LPRVSDLLWVLSSFVLTALSHIFFSHGPDFTGGAYYIAFVMTYSLAVFILDKFKLLKDGEIKSIYFFLGSLILFAGYPLFENDHFRYLWEGKVFLQGLNPYLNAPNSPLLSHLVFEGKEFIGFKSLTSIYPPLGLLWMGLGGLIGSKGGLFLLMGLNALLVYFLFTRLLQWKVRPLHLALVFPYFQKEFIQSIHIDLLAFMFIFLFLTVRQSRAKMLLLIAMSYWVKILGILALPIVFFRDEKKGPLFWISAALVVLSLPLVFYFYIGDMTGPSAFGSKWVWMPGFYTILTRVMGVAGSSARAFSLMAFVVYLLFVLFHFRFKNKNELNFLYLVFLGVMFFSPVYNAWYAIWFLGLALLLRSNFGVLYGVFSCWGYIAWGNSSLIPLGEIMAHFFFPFCLWEVSFLSSRSARSIEQKISKISLQ